MKGAIIGDIVGSVYEHDNIQTKNFRFWGKRAHFTAKTVCTIAVGKAFRKYEEYESCGNVNGVPITGEKLEDFLTMFLHNFGYKCYREYNVRFGPSFDAWLQIDAPEPFNCKGSGAPARCSSAGMLADSARHAFELGMITAQPTHNHVDAMIAAGLTAELIWHARNGATKEKMREIADQYYVLPKLDDISAFYELHRDAEETMDAALIAFFESEDFEDAVRNAISIGGNGIAAITGAIAEAYYGVPDEMWTYAKRRYLPEHLIREVDKFYWHLEHRDEVRLRNNKEEYYSDFYDD